jgi:hypothetical protein
MDSDGDGVVSRAEFMAVDPESSIAADFMSALEGAVLVFERDFSLEDAIESHDCWVETLPSV